jgi:hypothetical protein
MNERGLLTIRVDSGLPPERGDKSRIYISLALNISIQWKGCDGMTAA